MTMTMAMNKQEILLLIHLIGILFLTLGPYVSRNDSDRVLYLKLVVAVTLQWVLLRGRCSLSILEHRLQDKEKYPESKDTASGVWTRLARITGVRQRTLVLMNMATYVVNVTLVAAVVGTREARILATASIAFTALATFQWYQRDIFNFKKMSKIEKEG